MIHVALLRDYFCNHFATSLWREGLGAKKPIDAVNWELPSYGLYKRKIDVNIVFGAFEFARWHHRVNNRLFLSNFGILIGAFTIKINTS